jgi:hypothetical protein
MATVRTGSNGAFRSGGTSGTNAVLRFRNRLINVYRGTEIGPYGEETNVGTGGPPAFANVPAAIAETSQDVFDPATQRPQTIRSIEAILPAWAPVLETDTLEDVTTGYFYLVEDIAQRASIGYYPPDQLVTLRMRSGISTSSD